MLKEIQKIVSPRSSFGPLFLSVMLHALIVGGIVGAMKLKFFDKKEVQEEYVDLGYEAVEEPLPVREEKPVVKAEPDPMPDKTPPDTSPRELQDDKSEVAGTQVAKKPVSAPQSAENSIPYYKIKPKYPRAALVAGIEGWVKLEIDINEQGEVENVRVIDGEQRNMFQAEARRAVSLYKYKPFVDANGKPMRVANHTIMVNFSLKEEDASSQ
jgi:TonB family protein